MNSVQPAPPPLSQKGVCKIHGNSEKKKLKANHRFFISNIIFASLGLKLLIIIATGQSEKVYQFSLVPLIYVDLMENIHIVAMLKQCVRHIE